MDRALLERHEPFRHFECQRLDEHGRAVPVDDLIRSQLSRFADLIGDRILLEGPHRAAGAWGLRPSPT